ncbi:MAG: hypothetical protein JEZ12_11130 [Desulfobacterium sp.]|nr:hypothetical protein [Desulfobacterium sp.]
MNRNAFSPHPSTSLILFNCDAYLQRVGYNGKIAPTADMFIAHHQAQFYTIPFENFDIQFARGINLHPETISKKDAPYENLRPLELS